MICHWITNWKRPTILDLTEPYTPTVERMTIDDTNNPPKSPKRKRTTRPSAKKGAAGTQPIPDPQQQPAQLVLPQVP